MSHSKIADVGSMRLSTIYDRFRSKKDWRVWQITLCMVCCQTNVNSSQFGVNVSLIAIAFSGCIIGVMILCIAMTGYLIAIVSA